ncbi:MAG: biliverdin-producing heme oxygenase [Nocardioides sp.]|nr:biliverdin-producing heme oxygenase [Nocardioides sp.]
MPTALPSLASALRDGSRAEHEAAEGSAFMAELLAGALNEDAYRDYLLRLRTVYTALEDAVRSRAGDPLVAAVHDPGLERLATIDADLAHWAPGTDPALAAGAVDSPAARAYAERLAECAHGWGGLLVAHHYTRYLGDLSGGQAIGQVLDRSFDLDGAGLSFYAFEAVPKPKPYKDAYRSRLDALGLGPEDVERAVAEVRAAFLLNQALFAELGRNLPAYRRPAA